MVRISINIPGVDAVADAAATAAAVQKHVALPYTRCDDLMFNRRRKNVNWSVGGYFVDRFSYLCSFT